MPYLHARGIYPDWEIRSLHYGDPPDFVTVPGALDLAYVPPAGPYRTVLLGELRRRHAHILGNDWAELSQIWHAYFKIPPRVVQQADALFPQGRVLGIHYRGTDKQTTTWDSNPITQEQYLTLVREFLAGRSDFDVIFAATDEHSFIERLRSSIDLPVVALGEVDFHMAVEQTVSRVEKTDRAVLDCVLLSRCQCVLETSSALPSFAKVLNPDLEIYRCAASKLFGELFSGMPYFPVAYVPILPAQSGNSAEILRLTMESDWTQEERAARFRRKFTFFPRWPRNHRLYSLTDRFGVSELAARVLSGYR